MKNLTLIHCILILILLVSACKNRELNEGEQFKPREIHEDQIWHFDRIRVDAVEYLVLEKDNNNPHEGFGFMALRGNELFAKQDSILAYLKTQQAVQVEILALLSKKSKAQVQSEVDQLFQESYSAYAKKAEALKARTASSILRSEMRD